MAADFKLNVYDLCVANNMIGGKHMTICWHIDDLKISHVSLKAVDKKINWLDKLYPSVRAMRGKFHDF